MAQAPPKPAPDQPVTAAYYYRVKWGFQDEFERLFLKNHYPVLKAEMTATGPIQSVLLYRPTFHGDGRADWTYLVVITYKSWAAMNQPREEGPAEAPLPRPGHLRARRAAPLRDPGRALGRAPDRRRAPEVARSPYSITYPRQCPSPDPRPPRSAKTKPTKLTAAPTTQPTIPCMYYRISLRETKC